MEDDNIFTYTPIYGKMSFNKIRFSDMELIPKKFWKSTSLRKIKLWYGTPKDMPKNMKSILGFQATYFEYITSKKYEKFHGIDIANDNIIVKELELKSNDYFTEFEIEHDDQITYLKFITKNGNFLEIGEKNKNQKVVTLFEKLNEPFIIHIFSGFYDQKGLLGLGCLIFPVRKLVLMSKFAIFLLRFILGRKKEKKEEWLNPEKYNKLSLEMKAIVRTCTMPKLLFLNIMRFCL